MGESCAQDDGDNRPGEPVRHRSVIRSERSARFLLKKAASGTGMEAGQPKQSPSSRSSILATFNPVEHSPAQLRLAQRSGIQSAQKQPASATSQVRRGGPLDHRFPAVKRLPGVPTHSLPRHGPAHKSQSEPWVGLCNNELRALRETFESIESTASPAAPLLDSGATDWDECHPASDSGDGLHQSAAG